MTHLSKLEIAKLVKIKYKGSQSEEDVRFLKDGMDHLLLCDNCYQMFKKSTQTFVNALNYKFNYKENSLEKVCHVIYEKGRLLLQQVSNDFFVDVLDSSLSYTRGEYSEHVDYLIYMQEEKVHISTFEDKEIYIVQNGEIISYTSFIKDNETYEQIYVFDDVDIQKEFIIVYKVR